MTDFPTRPQVALDPKDSIADGLEIAALRSEISTLTARLAEVEGAHATLDAAAPCQTGAALGLAARIGRLSAERDAYEVQVRQAESVHAEQMEEIDQLRAEVERLRGAVEEIHASLVGMHMDLGSNVPPSWRGTVESCLEKASSVLAPREDCTTCKGSSFVGSWPCDACNPGWRHTADAALAPEGEEGEIGRVQEIVARAIRNPRNPEEAEDPNLVGSPFDPWASKKEVEERDIDGLRALVLRPETDMLLRIEGESGEVFLVDCDELRPFFTPEKASQP